MTKVYTLAAMLFVCGNVFSQSLPPPATANPDEYSGGCKGAVRAAYEENYGNSAVNELNHKLRNYPKIKAYDHYADMTGVEQDIRGFAKSESNRNNGKGKNYWKFYEQRLAFWINYCNQIRWGKQY